MGICGGLQMLGRKISDPLGIEGEAGASLGLGWLELETTLAEHKQLRNVSGELQLGGARVSGYEIHAGTSSGAGLSRAVIALDDGRMDGAMSADGQVLATYLHGIFELPGACSELLQWMGLPDAQSVDQAALREEAIDRLADAAEVHLDLGRLLDPLQLPV
jgi:adenosylcobyric acid synthase